MTWIQSLPANVVKELELELELVCLLKLLHLFHFQAMFELYTGEEDVVADLQMIKDVCISMCCFLPLFQSES